MQKQKELKASRQTRRKSKKRLREKLKRSRKKTRLEALKAAKKKKRPIVRDFTYRDRFVTMFVNRLMKHGKKLLAYRIMYKAMAVIKRKTKRNPRKILARAMLYIQPSVEVKAKRVGGSVYQVPMKVKPARSKVLAVRWILAAARKRGGKGIVLKLVNELIDAATKTGGARKRRTEIYRMARANRAFAKFRNR